MNKYTKQRRKFYRDNAKRLTREKREYRKNNLEKMKLLDKVRNQSEKRRLYRKKYEKYYRKKNIKHIRLIAKVYREKNREKIRLINSQSEKRKRLKCIEKYGNKCVCCGEREKVFLAFDHIENDGAKHRRIVGKSNIERWIVKNNYPKTLQLLCHNCNWGKRVYKICPHKLNQNVNK